MEGSLRRRSKSLGKPYGHTLPNTYTYEYVSHVKRTYIRAFVDWNFKQGVVRNSRVCLFASEKPGKLDHIGSSTHEKLP